MAYRIEIASSNRAGCNATHCKKEGVKIPKGEIRQGVWVDYQDSGSYKWRHWGCVTPEVLHNWNEKSEGEMSMIDGFDELPEGAQAKVRRALEQGHVDDEDWNGDIECNRWTGHKSQGMFVKGQAKRQKDAEEADEDDDQEPAPAKKPAGKKRKAAETNDDDNDGADDVKPASKKAKAKPKNRKKAVEDADEEAEQPAPKTSRAKKVKAVDEASSPVKAPAAKKGRGKKAAPEAEPEDEAHELANPEAVPTPASAPKKKGRKAAPKEDGDDAGEGTTKPKPKKRKTASKKAAASEED